MSASATAFSLAQLGMVSDCAFVSWNLGARQDTHREVLVLVVVVVVVNHFRSLGKGYARRVIEFGKGRGALGLIK